MTLLISKKIHKPLRRQPGVPHRMLNILMPQVVLDRPRIQPVVRELESTGMVQHVRMGRKIESSPFPPLPGDQLTDC